MRSFISKILPLAFLCCSAVGLSAQNSDAEWGIASLYSDDFAGRLTAYGVKYNPNELTAAHKRHPQGTMLRVTRLDNNKSVVVKVTDKGPYIKGRVVDLSRAAGERLSMIKDGIAEVKVEVVGGSSKSTAQPATSTAKASSQPKSYENQSTARIDDSRKEESKAAPAAKKATKTASSSKSGASARLVGTDYQKYGLYKIVLEKPDTKGFGVQVASLENYENVFKQVADLQAKWFDNIMISIERGSDKPVYKVILGPFSTEDSADGYRKSLLSKHKIKGFVVDLSTAQY